MKQKLILLVFLSIAMISHGERMSLKECIRQGIANNRTILNARIDIEKGHTGVSQNRARLLPVITGILQATDYLKSPVNVTTGTLLGNDFPDNPTWQTIRSMQYNVSAGVQLNMPLYNQSIYATLDVAKTVERLSIVSYKQATEELTVQIGKVYYLAQASLELERLTGENISRMHDLCTITEAMYEQGIVLEVDLNRAKINLQNLMAQQNQYSMLYEQQINLLKFLLDLTPDMAIEIDEMSDRIDLFQSPGIYDNIPELEMARIQEELAHKKIRAVKSGYIPTLSLTGYAGGLSYQEKISHFFHTGDSSRNWFGNCFIALNITIPIFDANSKKLQIRQHHYEARQAHNRIEQLHDRLVQEHSNSILQLEHNLEVYHTQAQSYRQAKDVYNVTEEQYREGVSSMTAILQDEMQLRLAQSACIQAHCQLNLACLDLLRLSGNLSSLME